MISILVSQVSAHVNSAANQEALKAIVQNNHEDIRALILQLLSNPDGPRQVAEFENSGQHVAQRVMEQGQLVSP